MRDDAGGRVVNPVLLCSLAITPIIKPGNRQGTDAPGATRSFLLIIAGQKYTVLSHRRSPHTNVTRSTARSHHAHTVVRCTPSARRSELLLAGLINLAHGVVERAVGCERPAVRFGRRCGPGVPGHLHLADHRDVVPLRKTLRTPRQHSS